MSYPGLREETLLELKEREHQDYHIAEHIFDEGCEWCKVEKCGQCKGLGMSQNGTFVCGKCNGRGRLL